MKSLLLPSVSAIGLLLLAGCDPSMTETPPPNAAVRLFESRLTYQAGGAPFALTAGDVNADGRPDAVVANAGANAVGVLLAADDGFAPVVSYPVGTAPAAVALADLNADAKLDAIAVNNLADNISVLLNNGDGTFATAVPYALVGGSLPLAIAVADINGDTFPDAVVANSGNGSITMLFGLGDGTFFDEIIHAPVGAGPRSVATGDFNVDGFMDIAVAERDPGTVSVLFGVGEGVFSPLRSFAVGATPRQVAAADVTGDQRLDLVVTTPGSQQVAVLVNGGPDIFLPAIRTELPLVPTRFSLGDYNADGKVDIASVVFREEPEPEALAMLLIAHGDGTGRFNGGTRILGTGPGALDVAHADFTGDARGDLLTADTGASTVSLLRGRNGGFETDERFAVGLRPRAIVTADFNRDSNVDAAVTNLDSRNISIMLGRGDGTFVPHVTLPVSDLPRAITQGLLNGDQLVDLAVTNLNSSRVSVFLGRADGTFEPERFASVRTEGENRSAEPRSIVIADMNKDGKQDVVTGNAGTDSIAILLGDGNGGFGTPQEFEAGNFPLAVAVRDIDADQNLDVIVTNGFDPEDQGSTPGRVNTLLGKGDGTLDEETRASVATGNTPRDMQVGELDGDGLPDAVTVHQNDGQVFLLRGNGDGVAPGEGRPAGTLPNSVFLADLSGDGDIDIATSNDDGSVNILENERGLTFTLPLRFPVGGDPIGVHVSDLNKDNIPDILTANRSTNQISVLLGAE